MEKEVCAIAVLVGEAISGFKSLKYTSERHGRQKPTPDTDAPSQGIASAQDFGLPMMRRRNAPARHEEVTPSRQGGAMNASLCITLSDSAR
jgi:hypothetical protein